MVMRWMCVDCGGAVLGQRLEDGMVRCEGCAARVAVMCGSCGNDAPSPAKGLRPICDDCASKLGTGACLAFANERSPYPDIGRAIGDLVAEKQRAYGDSFGKSGEVMALLYPDGIPLDKLDDALTVVRVVDKLFRVATDRDALGEDPWRDIAGYGLLSVRRNAVKAETAERERSTAVSKASP